MTHLALLSLVPRQRVCSAEYAGRTGRRRECPMQPAYCIQDRSRLELAPVKLEKPLRQSIHYVCNSSTDMVSQSESSARGP